MKKAVAISLVLLAITISAAAQTANDWIRYASPAGRYNVLLPREPTLSQREVFDEKGKRFLQFKAASIEETDSFFVGYYDYQSPVTFSFEKARDAIVNSIGATLIAEEEIILEGSPGRQLKMSATKNGFTLMDRARLYDVGRRVYILQCIYPKEMETPEMEARVNSFLTHLLSS